MNLHKYKYIPFLALALVMLGSCASNNAPIVKQTYHDLTGHYNTYFNGNELYKEALRSIETSRTENYDEILPLYAYGTEEDTKNQASQFETIISKAELTVQKHQTKESNKNYKAGEDNSVTNWADDAFLLIGKSYFMMGDYEKSIRSLRYVTAHFEEGIDARSKKKIKKQKNNKKRKKKLKKQEKKEIDLIQEGKDIRPSLKLTQHESANSQALIWLVKSYTAQSDFASADAVLTHINSDLKFIKDYDSDVALAKADLALKQNNVTEAISALEEANELIKRQKNKNRYQFVLAQLYESAGQNSLAASFYDQSVKANSNFEMAFYAKLKLIQMARSGGYDADEAQKLIAKMLKDGKNKDYYDQLWYERAVFAMNDGERDDAVKFLRKSVETSKGNNKQKARSFLMLADIYYDEENYIAAQANYDSTLQFMDRGFENYDYVENRSAVLTELVMDLNTIELNDSLLLLASMPQKEREDLLYELALSIVDAEDEAALKAENELMMEQEDETSSKGKNSKQTWYFYSESSRKSGYKKFQQIWGDRPLEDNWRRSNKGSNDGEDGEDEFEIEDNDYFSRVTKVLEDLLRDIPTTDSDKEVLENEIIDAYYGSAVNYRLGLDNLEKSIQQFEKLISKYPDNKYLVEAYYNLYLLYDDLQERSKSDKYKQLVLKEFPNSEFAKVIKNPDYLKQVDPQISSVREYYESTYIMYTESKNDQVINRCEDASDRYPGNDLQPKFDLLKALAIGQKKLYDPYIASLEYVVATHKNTDEQKKASEILAYLKGEDPSGKDLDNKGKVDVDTKSKLLDLEDEIGPIKGNKEKESMGEDEKGLKLKFGEKELKLGGKKEEDPE